MTEEYFYLGAKELLELYQSKELSPFEYSSALLSRIEGSSLNAFCTIDPDLLLDQSRAAEQKYITGDYDRASEPLLGIPISVKDNIETAGVRTTYGSRIYSENIPTTNAIAVERMYRAGAVLLGKTNLPEFATKGVTDSPLFGDTRNPWKLNAVVGGSTGGGAAAVAAGLGPIAIGNDQAGSIRMPAALCGVYGFKPTAGRVPFYPNLFPWDPLFHTGFIARNVEDIELIFEVEDGFDSRDPVSVPPMKAPAMSSKITVAWSEDLGFAEIEPEVLALVEKALNQIEEFASINPVNINLEASHRAYEVFVPFKRFIESGNLVEENIAVMDPAVSSYILAGKNYGVSEVGEAYYARTEVFERTEKILTEHDFLITPTLSVTAFEIGKVGPDLINGKPLESFRDWFPYTYPFNLSGHPAISIPIGFTKAGLPVGLQIVGKRHADNNVLEFAKLCSSRAVSFFNIPPHF